MVANDSSRSRKAGGGLRRALGATNYLPGLSLERMCCAALPFTTMGGRCGTRLRKSRARESPAPFRRSWWGSTPPLKRSTWPTILPFVTGLCDWSAEQDAYAALLVSMHTYNLLTARADRSTIVPEQLSLLDEFLVGQKALQERLYASIQDYSDLTPEEKSWERVEDHFKLLQGTDNLSLLSCVNYDKPATLLHSLRTTDGESQTD